MMNSKELFERSLRVSPGGVHSPVRSFKSVGREPIFFSSAKGAYINSVEGDRYIDFCQSFGPNILGHRDPDVQAVVSEMIDKVWSLGACDPYSLELSEWIIERLNFIQKLRFVCSGTEAVMSVLRLARAATKREKILKFNGCYHGHVDSMLVKAGSGLAGDAASDSAGVSEQVAKTTLVCDLDDDKGLEEVFKKEGANIAAVIIEPLPANFGLLIQREEFIEKIFTLARKHKALVIFDEVISGFRVGLGGMAEKLGVKPDIVTYGKIIGGSFPVGCYAASAELMDMMAPSGPVYQAGTLAANPIGMCAGLATLKKLETCDVFNVLNERTHKFTQKLQQGFDDNNLDLSVQSESSLFWIHKKSAQKIRSIEQFSKGHAESYKGLFNGALKRGVYMAPSAYEVGFVSYAHTDEILSQAADAIIDAAKESHVQA